MVGKDRLVFDVTDADTIADSDSVGAYVRASDGSLITHTEFNAGAIQALDVNVAGGTVTCDLNGIYDDPDNLLPDNVGAIFFTRAVTPGLAEQVQTVTAATLATVASADVSKIHALDVNAFLSAKNDDSGDLEQVLISDIDGGLSVHIATDPALANTAIAHAKNPLTAANTAEDVVVAPLASRKYLMIYNNGNRKIFIGATGVDAATGFPLSPGSVMELRAGAAVDIEWVGPDVSQEIRTLELS